MMRTRPGAARPVAGCGERAERAGLGKGCGLGGRAGRAGRAVGAPRRAACGTPIHYTARARLPA